MTRRRVVLGLYVLTPVALFMPTPVRPVLVVPAV